MGFAQLYYTSCEQGLDGCSGYQFNAATPGVDPRVLREVERFTTYEPPRSAPLEDVAAHPVNLCYSPDLGGEAVLSRVVSVGADPSGRPGNYFAHSLVRQSHQGAAPLPAELWDAGFWERVPSPDPDLPVLHVSRAPLDRRCTGQWLRGSALRRSHLVRLLEAVDTAIDGGRPVLLVADSVTVAHCVALLSHLLSPERARALSFATYCGRPDTASVHVMGMPAGSGTHGLHGGFATLALDLDGEDALPEVDGDHRVLVRHLVDLGPEQAPHLWERLSRYASGRERSLADWWPVLVATTLLDEPEAVPAQHLATAHDWLVGAEWLPHDLTVPLLTRMVEARGEGLSHGVLADLQRVAHRTGSEEAITLLEKEIALRSLGAIAHGAHAPPVAPMRSATVREAARERIGSFLDTPAGGGVTPGRVVELLRWAREGNVIVPATVLERYGAVAIAEELLLLPPGAAPDTEVALLVEGYEGIRKGVATTLARLPDPRLEPLATGPVGGLLVRDRSGASVRLRELRRLAEGPVPDPAQLLRELVTVRREARFSAPPGLPAYDVDEDLLTRVWGRGHGPSAAERTLARLSRDDLLSPGVVDWIARALVEIPTSAEAGAWRTLAASVAEHWLYPDLPDAARQVLADWAVVRAALDQVQVGGERDGARYLATVYAQAVPAHPAVREAARHRVAELLLTWRGPNLLARVLRDCPPEVFTAYADRAGEELAGERPDTTLAALLFTSVSVPVWAQDHGGRARTLEHKVLAPALGGWERRSVVAVRKQLRGEQAKKFEAWRKELRGPRGPRKWWGGHAR